MVDVKTRYDGFVVFWSLSEFFDRARLKAGWEAIGIGDETPEERPAVSVLKDALTESFARQPVLVRPLAAKNGFTVQRENRGTDDNSYNGVFTAKVYDDTSDPVFTGDEQLSNHVLHAYRRNRGRIPGSQMSAALTRLLSKLGGIRIRPTGAVYWLPGDRYEQWDAVMSAVSNAADGGQATGYVIRHDLDAVNTRAILDALVSEVKTEAKRLTDDILSGQLGDRAVATRKKEAGELKDKVAEYERLLGVGLAHLRKTLEEVEMANASAAILLAADPFAGQQEVVANVVV